MKPKQNESKQDFLKRCVKEVMVEGKSNKEAFEFCNSDWNMSDNKFCALSSEDGNSVRSFMITAYTGCPIQLAWGAVIFDLSGMKSKHKIPVLREHGRDRIVGFGEGWKDNQNFYVSGEFSKATNDAREVLALADEGYPWQGSIGVVAKKVKVLTSEQETDIVNGYEISDATIRVLKENPELLAAYEASFTV